MADHLLAEVRAHLDQGDLSKANAGLLRAFLELAPRYSGHRVPREVLAAALDGGALSDEALRKRFGRLDVALRAQHATFVLTATSREVIAEPTAYLNDERAQDGVGRDLRSMTSEKVTFEPDDMVPPAAIRAQDPSALTVMWSYAWLDNGGPQDEIQGEVFEKLEHKLRYPVEPYRHLKISLWRDVHQRDLTSPFEPQLDAACQRAFLAVVMLSDKYPHSSDCLRELDHFLDDPGDNRPGKQCLIVGVNIGKPEAPKRFTFGNRLIKMGPGDKTLFDFWETSNIEGVKNRYVDEIAREIFKAAERHRSIPAPPASKDIEDYLRDRLRKKAIQGMIDPRAEHGEIRQSSAGRRPR